MMMIISTKEQLRYILDKLDAHRCEYISLDAKYDHTSIQKEIRYRTQVAVWAYAYEMHNDSMVSNEVFDEFSLKINPKLITLNNIYDTFFQNEFSPYTGMGIHKFPTPENLEIYYQAWKKYNNPLKVVKNI